MSEAMNYGLFEPDDPKPETVLESIGLDSDQQIRAYALHIVAMRCKNSAESSTWFFNQVKKVEDYIRTGEVPD